MTKITKLFVALFVLSFAVLLASCATQPPAEGSDIPGFFMGLFHGFIILFSLIFSIFTDVRIYAFPNTGFFYDLGFFIGASAFLGGGGAGARGKK